MIKYILAIVILSVSVAAQAQQAGHMHSPVIDHGGGHVTENHAPTVRPTEPGQAAFAAIQEIVSILDADPNTDWSKIDIEALRRHLVDMNNVTLYAEAVATRIEHGMRFSVTGSGPVRDSIRRMVRAHARTMDGRNGWRFTAHDEPEGATLTVTVADTADLNKLKGLGFIGVMAYGMHHQEHHLMIASGRSPHH